LALLIEQECIAFDLGEHEFAGVGGENRVQQLIDDVGAVYELGLGQKLRVAANVRDQNRCAFSHCPSSSKVCGRGLERFTRLTRENHRSFFECGSICDQILLSWPAAIRTRHLLRFLRCPTFWVKGAAAASFSTRWLGKGRF